MKKILITDLARIIKAHQKSDMSNEFFTGVSIDSRTIKPGDCFFAIPGENFDGHDFVSDAFSKGAVCAVVSKDISPCVMSRASCEKKEMDSRFRGNDSTHYAKHNMQYNILKVDDTVKALGDFAKAYRQQAGFKVVAITGSVGKTTTRHITYHALSKHLSVFQSPKNFNNNIGLPLTLLGAEPEYNVVVAELGTNHPGEIAYLTGIAQPDIAVVTNVYPVHLEGLGSLETIIQEKLSISEGLKHDGILVINADFDYLLDAAPARGFKFITFGKSARTDYRATDIISDGSSSRFAINGVDVYLPLPGPGNIENALAACAVCNQMSLTIDDFAQAVKNLPAVSMRAELLQIGTLTILNDCYNANPASMENALQILSGLGPSQSEKKFSTRPNQKRRTVFICGDMAELGRQAELLHSKLGESIAKARVRLLLAIGKFANVVAQSAKKAADSSGHHLQAECFDDTISACNKLQKFIKD